MKETKNIITIRKTDSSKANCAFADLMEKTESIFNERSKSNHNLYKKISSSDLEKATEFIIKEACFGTPFDANNVKLISGQAFPDIIAEKYYGVEVKSTDKNHWTSTGSSIVESTRDKYVENIYMLFGKLGGNPPEFRCRPYQDVLYDITVTHSPRYLINMELQEGKSIFAKMNTTYDELRTSKDSIEQVRRYYKEKANKENKKEMPWWLTSSEPEIQNSFNVRLWNSLTIGERRDLLSKSLILFPETMSPKQNANKYIQTTLWLCACYQVVMPNIRDIFSAGGKISSVNGVTLKTPIPKIFKTIVESAEYIKSLLEKPNENFKLMLMEYNPSIKNYNDWLNLCRKIGKENNIPLIQWIEDNVNLK